MPEQRSGGSRVAKLAGLALAGLGVAHFVNPELFDGLTGQAFPRDTRKHVYIDGGIETAIGLGLISRKTRQAGHHRVDRLRRLSGGQRRPQPVAAEQREVEQPADRHARRTVLS